MNPTAHAHVSASRLRLQTFSGTADSGWTATP